MGRGKKLTKDQQFDILLLKSNNYTLKQIANRLKCSKNTVFNFLKNPKKYGTIKSTGRPKKLGKREISRLVREAAKGKTSVKVMKNDLQLNCSVSTIKRELKKTKFLKYAETAYFAIERNPCQCKIAMGIRSCGFWR